MLNLGCTSLAKGKVWPSEVGSWALGGCVQYNPGMPRVEDMIEQVPWCKRVEADAAVGGAKGGDFVQKW